MAGAASSNAGSSRAKRSRKTELDEYARKRDFTATSEPSTASRRRARRAAGEGPVFVVQKHDARRLHYDFRLEIDGTLKSWAVPKGPSLDPGQKRLAVHVEDHPLDYGNFEGRIPEGHYGAGEVIVWDRGTWEPADADPLSAYRAGKLKFHLLGEKLSGGWTLVRTRLRGSGDKEQWLLIKESDDAARKESDFDIVAARPESVLSNAELVPKATRRKGARAKAEPDARASALDGARAAKLPERLAPELATLVDAPPDGDWRYELKFDGYRILARVKDGAVRLFTRNGNDWTGKLAAVADAVGKLALGNAWLDGEIVMLGTDGLPDFQALQNAFEDRRTEQIVYYVFDLMYHEGQDLRASPLEQRRALLERVLAQGEDERLRYSEDFSAGHRDILRSACDLKLEGVIGKRAGSHYVSRRSPDWIKLKCTHRQEFVIGGYTAPQGSRKGFGALLLGVHDAKGELRYAGRVGTGFTATSLEAVLAKMRPLARATPAFANPPSGGDAKGVTWLEPRLLCEVEFGSWTREGIVRHAVFHGLRDDKAPRSIVREEARDAASAEQRPKRTSSSGSKRRDGREPVAGVSVSHPDRVIDADSGTTKLGLARFYCEIAPRLLPHLIGRPVSILRAPTGVAGEQFFQRHAEKLSIPGMRLLEVADGDEPLMEVASVEALVGAVQMGTIEFHPWNARSERMDRPDRIVFDLDPDPALPWTRMIEATELVLTLLDELGLDAFLKTSGGKGMHVVVPLARRHDWEQVKAFSKAVTQHLARVMPRRFAGQMGPKNRVGKIFVDYLRNQKGASTVAAYSVRARPGLPVSVPIARDELARLEGAATWTVRNVAARLEALADDPWAGYGHGQSITRTMRQRLGID